MYCGHQSSLICFLHLLRSMASSLFNLHGRQSFCTISVQVFFGSFCSGTLHFILHTFLHPSIVFFSQHMCPYHCSLFCCSTEIMWSNPSLSFNPLLGTQSFSLMPHIQAVIWKNYGQCLWWHCVIEESDIWQWCQLQSQVYISNPGLLVSHHTGLLMGDCGTCLFPGWCYCSPLLHI